MRFIYKIIKISVLTFCLGYFLCLFFGSYIQTILTFPAIYYNVQDFVGHIKANIDFEEINITDSEGNNINGLYLPYGDGGVPTVYYFHGNGGPLSYFYSEIEYINSLGYNVISYDYPGYGKSEGFPSKKRIKNFSHLFYKHIQKQKNIRNQDLIIWGYSIGTAVATQFAATNEFSKLVLVAPLASRYDMSKQIFGFVTQKFFFLPNSFDTYNLVKNFTKPVLIIHGNNDKIVSFAQGKKVFQHYKGPKNFIEIDQIGHNYIIDFQGSNLRYFLSKFLKGHNQDFENNYVLLDTNEKNKIQQRIKQEKFIQNFDLDSDISLTKFVNSQIPFNDTAYTPKNLQKIASEFVLDTKNNTQLLAKESNDALQKLAEDFYKHFQQPLVVVSAYRSYEYQQRIKQRGCPDNLCAKAGYSEHQSGLGVDFFEASTKASWDQNKKLTLYYQWLYEHAHKYGFHNTYQKGLEIDGYEIEPWHWRYVGPILATYLKTHNLTFAEFYYAQKK